MNVQIKQLEWHGPDLDDEYYSKTMLGTYSIGSLRADGTRWSMGQYHPSVETAKAAAQADFDQRIRSALASPPSPAQASPFDERDATNLLSVIADIREKSGLGAKPMLSELADAIAAKVVPTAVVTDAMIERFRSELVELVDTHLSAELVRRCLAAALAQPSKGA